MAGGNDYIASIDIGTDKIAILVAEKEDNARLRIIGHNISPSRSEEHTSELQSQ